MLVSRLSTAMYCPEAYWAVFSARHPRPGHG